MSSADNFAVEILLGILSGILNGVEFQEFVLRSFSFSTQNRHLELNKLLAEEIIYFKTILDKLVFLFSDELVKHMKSKLEKI